MILKKISKQLLEENERKARENCLNEQKIQKIFEESQKHLLKLSRMIIDYKYQIIFLNMNKPCKKVAKFAKPEFFTFDDFENGKLQVSPPTETPKIIESLQPFADLSSIIHSDYSNWCKILKTSKKEEHCEEKIIQKILKKREESPEERLETNADIEVKDHNIFNCVSLIKPKRFIPNYADSLKTPFHKNK